MTTIARSSVGGVALAGVVSSDVQLTVGNAPPATVSEICAPALLLGVQLRSATAFGDPQMLRRRMTELLDRTDEQLREARVVSPDLSNIVFALAAFLDESIGQSSWDHRTEWVAAPLCFERFNRFDGGEEFFVRLQALTSTQPPPPDVLQIYFLCLTLGFKGRYLLRSNEEWYSLVADVGALVRNTNPSRQAATSLSPRGLPGEAIAEAVKEIPMWVFAVAGAGLALVTYFALTLMINWRAASLEHLIR
jgi:type VI secretion system protein ImpK